MARSRARAAGALLGGPQPAATRAGAGAGAGAALASGRAAASTHAAVVTMKAGIKLKLPILKAAISSAPVAARNGGEARRLGAAAAAAPAPRRPAVRGSAAPPLRVLSRRASARGDERGVRGRRRARD